MNEKCHRKFCGIFVCVSLQKSILENEGYIFGIRPVIEAINAGREIDGLMIQQGLRSDAYNELRELMRTHRIECRFVPIQKLNRITRKNHQGVIAWISEISYHEIENLAPTLFEAGKTPLLLVLDRVTDVRNFGAIARTAECAGVHAIIIPLQNSVRVSADAIKSSAGALNIIPVCRSKNLKATLQYLKQSGIQLTGCTEKTSKNYYDANFTTPMAIIMGSEEDGISPAYLEMTDEQLKIEMAGTIASLNVSVAAGIILFEAHRQRVAENIR
jgi:23S rRNA (guanosine2251-2'-O)-methyltransferase